MVKYQQFYSTKYSVDIDDNYDFVIAETLFKKKKYQYKMTILPIEIKVREFHSKIFLSLQIIRQNKF